MPGVLTLALALSPAALPQAPPPAGAPVGYPYAISTTDPATYPGWWSADQPYSLPLPIRIHAIQITIRLWDVNTKQTRQSSIVVDL